MSAVVMSSQIGIGAGISIGMQALPSPHCSTVVSKSRSERQGRDGVGSEGERGDVHEFGQALV